MVPRRCTRPAEGPLSSPRLAGRPCGATKLWVLVVAAMVWATVVGVAAPVSAAVDTPGSGPSTTATTTGGPDDTAPSTEDLDSLDGETGAGPVDTTSSTTTPGTEGDGGRADGRGPATTEAPTPVVDDDPVAQPDSAAATDLPAPVPTAEASAPASVGLQVGSNFTPIDPVRIMDTRSGLGASGLVGPEGPKLLQVGGTHGVPAAGVTAVVLNVTVAGPHGPGFITAFPTGQPRPNASHLNFVVGRDVANQVTVALGDGGKVSFASPWAHTDLVADLVGWYGPDARSRYTPVSPTRILDTRESLGVDEHLVGGVGTTLDVAGHGGVPASGVSAVVLNMTVTDPTDAGHLTIHPSDQARPVVSSLNFVGGQTVANLVTVPLAGDGTIALSVPNGRVPVIADVAGYFSSNGSQYFAVPTTRVLDTRNGTGGAPGMISVSSPRTVAPASAMGIGFSGTTAVLANVTATEPTFSGFVTVHPAGAPRPVASNLNYVAGQTVPNAVLARLGGGSVAVANPIGSAHAIVDVSGFFATSGPYARSSFVDWDNRAKAVAGAENGKLSGDLLRTPVSGCTVFHEAADDIGRMYRDAWAEGVNLTPSSCYRDYAGQVAMREYWCGRGSCQFAAVPGTSNHGWGKAIDISEPGGIGWTTRGYQWLAENAWRYNIIHPNALGPTSSAPEPWHWEWVGDGGRMFG